MQYKVGKLGWYISPASYNKDIAINFFFVLNKQYYVLIKFQTVYRLQIQV